ncbi:MAG TPA: hypothetical protein VFH51_11575, partial [Myxococcota bacterium]|nr:hypothetical protein [Myxococcota bacterium]
PFVPKAAVILAAFLGLPSLMTLSPLATGLISGASGAVLASYGIVVLLGVTQLIAFIVGIQSWQSGQKEPRGLSF